MESTMLRQKMECEFALDNEDLLQDILARLPALDFASAACVSKSWNKVCNRILSRPKLATALSLSPSHVAAVDKLFNIVLSKPIRPHFAIVFVGQYHSLAATHKLITRFLGPQIPIITNSVAGIIGSDDNNNTIKEAKLIGNVPYNFGGVFDAIRFINTSGIVLVLGCVPGLKVEAIPLLRPKKDGILPGGPKVEMINNFLMNIMEYTTTVPDCTSPDAIIMFGDHHVNLKPVLVQMDNIMPRETVIVGDASGNFLFQRGDNSQRRTLGNSYWDDAVALVFVKKSSNAEGKINFDVMVSNGLVPYGPQLEVDAVIVEENRTWLTAKRTGHPEILDTRGLRREIRAKVPDRNLSFYIGVTHKKESSTGSQQLGFKSYMAYYKVIGEAEDFSIVVNGVGIKPGESFLFYHTNCDTAFRSSIRSFHKLRNLTEPAASTSHSRTTNSVCNKKEVLGGLIFSSFFRGEPLLRFNISESLPFHANYFDSPIAGQFCKGEIARVSTRLLTQYKGDEDENGENEESANLNGCFLHHYSTIYLVMTYTLHR